LANQQLVRVSLLKHFVTWRRQLRPFDSPVHRGPGDLEDLLEPHSTRRAEHAERPSWGTHAATNVVPVVPLDQHWTARHAPQDRCAPLRGGPCPALTGPSCCSRSAV